MSTSFPFSVSFRFPRDPGSGHDKFLIIHDNLKRYRTPLGLQVIEFMGAGNNSSLSTWVEAPGHEGGIADGPLPGPTGIATAQPGIWTRPDQGPILALPRLRIQLHNLPGQPLAREESKQVQENQAVTPQEVSGSFSYPTLSWWAASNLTKSNVISLPPAWNNFHSIQQS
jgi:hypothetical protein